MLTHYCRDRHYRKIRRRGAVVFRTAAVTTALLSVAALTSFECHFHKNLDDGAAASLPWAPAACCFLDLCEDLPLDECVELGGGSEGPGSTCSATSCPRAELVNTSPDYPCGSSLPRVGNHVLRLTFHVPVTQPKAGEVEIRELLPEGEVGPDLSGEFSFSLEEDGHVLRIAENGAVLRNETWYGVMNTGEWASVNAFEVDYVVIRGDANNSGSVSQLDFSAINASTVFEADTPDDSRFDINTVGGISYTDISAASAFTNSEHPVKPDGHGCFP